MSDIFSRWNEFKEWRAAEIEKVKQSDMYKQLEESDRKIKKAADDYMDQLHKPIPWWKPAPHMDPLFIKNTFDSFQMNRTLRNVLIEEKALDETVESYLNWISRKEENDQ